MSNCREARCRIKCSKGKIIPLSSLDELEGCLFRNFVLPSTIRRKTENVNTYIIILEQMIL